MSTLATLRNHCHYHHWKAAGLLVPGLLLCSAASADRIEKHFKVDAHPVVTIHNPNGMVTVRAWTKSDVMVVAKRATNQVEVDAEQTGNRVDVLPAKLPTLLRRTICAPILKSAFPKMPSCRFTTIRAA